MTLETYTWPAASGFCAGRSCLPRSCYAAEKIGISRQAFYTEDWHLGAPRPASTITF